MSCDFGHAISLRVGASGMDLAHGGFALLVTPSKAKPGVPTSAAPTKTPAGRGEGLT